MPDRIHKRNGERGFTLIEISIALIIVGLIMVPLLQLYKTKMLSQRISNTKQSIEIVQAALGKYVEKNGFYPAPSHPNIAINAAGSGIAVNPVVNPPAACAANSAVVCSTNTGGVDADGDGTADDVLIGSVPFTTLGIPYQAVMDGYGYQLKYAVTASMTAISTFNNARGAIRVLNDGRDPAQPQIYDPATPQAHYVVVSHGQDARGAFSQNGLIAVPCGTVANGLDFENCNNDTVFRSNIFQFEDTPDTTPGYPPDNKIQFNRVPGPNNFDDFVQTVRTTTSGLWSFIPNQSVITTTQDGNIQLGTDETCTNASCLPRVRMNVNGGVLVEQQLKTARLCNVNEADCRNDNAASTPYGWFTPQIIAGTPPILAETSATWDSARQGHRGAGIRCIGKRGLRGVNNFDEECQTSVIISNPTITGAGCDPTVEGGKFPIGISATGQIICQP